VNDNERPDDDGNPRGLRRVAPILLVQAIILPAVAVLEASEGRHGTAWMFIAIALVAVAAAGGSKALYRRRSSVLGRRNAG
jgi:hypothetical protein